MLEIYCDSVASVPDTAQAMTQAHPRRPLVYTDPGYDSTWSTNHTLLMLHQDYNKNKHFMCNESVLF